MDSEGESDFPWGEKVNENTSYSLHKQHETSLLQDVENGPMIGDDEEERKKFIEDLFNSSDVPSNFFQQEIGDVKNEQRERQQIDPRPVDNIVSMNVDAIEMDTYSSRDYQQILLHTAQTTDDEQYFHGRNMTSFNHDGSTQNERMPRSLTTANNNAIEEKMNGHEYCDRLLAKLHLAVKLWASVLRDTTISARTTGYYLKEFQIPSPANIGTNSEDPLNALSQIFQAGINLLSSFRWRCNIDHTNPIDLTSKEPRETLGRTMSTTNEHDRNRLHRNIQAIKRPILSMSTTPKEIDIIPSSLSRLLAEAKEIHESNLIQLKIAKQSQERWKKRTINSFNEKSTSCIQDRSGKEKQHPRIEWTKSNQYDGQNLFVLAQVLSYNDQPHPSNFIVPAGTKRRQPSTSKKRPRKEKTRLTLKDLDINDTEFDEKTRSILLPITPIEYNEGGKDLEVIMFGLYKICDQTASANELDNANEDEEMDANETDSTIKNEICKLSKLRLRLCQLTHNGALKFISKSVDTELIEECKGSVRESVTIINSAELCAKRLHKDGGEEICLMLSKDSEKKGFIIHLNGNELPADEFHGPTKQQIIFDSPPQSVVGQNYLELQVWKESILETIKRNMNPYEGLYRVLLLDIQIDYQSPNNNPIVVNTAAANQ